MSQLAERREEAEAALLGVLVLICMGLAAIVPTLLEARMQISDELTPLTQAGIPSGWLAIFAIIAALVFVGIGYGLLLLERQTDAPLVLGTSLCRRDHWFEMLEKLKAVDPGIYKLLGEVWPPLATAAKYSRRGYGPLRLVWTNGAKPAADVNEQSATAKEPPETRSDGSPVARYLNVRKIARSEKGQHTLECDDRAGAGDALLVHMSDFGCPETGDAYRRIRRSRELHGGSRGSVIIGFAAGFVVSAIRISNRNSAPALPIALTATALVIAAALWILMLTVPARRRGFRNVCQLQHQISGFYAVPENFQRLEGMARNVLSVRLGASCESSTSPVGAASSG